MKKGLLRAAMLCVAVVFMVSCQSNEGDVKKAAEGFIKALKAGDLEKAKGFTTEATQAKWGDFTQFVASQVSDEAKQAIANVNINISEVKVDGDNAEAVCTATIPYFAQEITVLHFTKVGDKWLLDEPNAIVSDVFHVEEDIKVVDTDSVPAN